MPAATAVFSGAGLSGAPPASLPMGNRLRDDILKIMFDGAEACAGGVLTRAHLNWMVGSGYKLEMVLGRLWGVIGEDALGCLFSLRIDLPNPAHLLSALHLAGGGSHVTVNFDVGIEYAYDLLTGTADLPAAYMAWRSELARWQALLPWAPEPLRVVTTKDEFDRWNADRRPPALLKVHGGLSRDQRRLLDIVVVDIEELGALWPTRLDSVATLDQARRLVITGYGGADPDVYAPLLSAAARTRAEWRCPSFGHGSPVADDARTCGIKLITGALGTATAALQTLLGIASLPAWPDDHADPSRYVTLLGEWTRELTAKNRAAELAHAWAWMSADAGDLDLAAGILQTAPELTADTAAQLRLAEILYARAAPGDLYEATRILRTAVISRKLRPEALDFCLLRTADLARKTLPDAGLAGRCGRLAWMIAVPVAVLARTGLGRRRAEPAADTYRQLGQTSLRLIEATAATAPSPAWPWLSATARLAARASARAEHLSGNGNRRALAGQQRLTLTVLAAALSRHAVHSDVVKDLSALRLTYRHAGDFPGAGNCSLALALAAAANGEHPASEQLLSQSWEDHRQGRATGQPLAGAKAAHARTRQIIDRLHG